MKQASLTQERLKEVLEYLPETGKFVWKVQRPPLKVGDEAGCVTGNGYALIRVDRKAYLAHRLAWLYVHGEFPEQGMDVDHINRCRTDNRIVNLRVVTRTQNNYNTTRRGTTFFKRDGTWRAQIQHNYKNIHIGYFKTEEEAHAAYIREKQKYT